MAESMATGAAAVAETMVAKPLVPRRLEPFPSL